LHARFERDLTKTMPLRNSPHATADLSDLSRLGELVAEKRIGQRSSATKPAVIAITKNSSSVTASPITWNSNGQRRWSRTNARETNDRIPR
jgi:hypothetical protein